LFRIGTIKLNLVEVFNMPLYKLHYCIFLKQNHIKALKIISSVILLNSIYMASLSYVFANEKVVKIVLNVAGKPPLNNQEQNGFIDLIAREAFKRLDITLETVRLPAERALLNANSGITDGEMSRIAGLNSKYTNLIQVNEKIMDWEFVVFSKREIELNKKWQSLIPYTVSIINGWKILEKNVPASVNLTKVKNPKQLFGMLKLQRSDLIIYEKWGGMYYLKSKKIKDVKLIHPPLIVKEMFIYLNKKHTELAIKLAGVLKSIKDDGTYEKTLSLTLKKLE